MGIFDFFRKLVEEEKLPEVKEKLPFSEIENFISKKDNEIMIFKKGTFTGFDKIHNGSGDIVLVQINGKNYIRFEENFNVNNGPDLYVGLGKNGEYIKDSELGKLKGNIGSQNYELPENINFENVHEVWIWCKAFSVPFAKAILFDF